jgi:hypothetical protein
MMQLMAGNVKSQASNSRAVPVYQASPRPSFLAQTAEECNARLANESELTLQVRQRPSFEFRKPDVIFFVEAS